MNTPLLIYFYLILIVSIYSFFVAVINFIYLKMKTVKSKKFDQILKNKNPKISILIPARNEEFRIKPTLNSILNQSYQNYDIWVLNDNSTDNTENILKEYSKKHSNFNYLNGKDLPAGWNGKQHALQQLIDASESDIVLFLDADLEVDKNFIKWATANLEKHQVDCFSAYPKHKYKLNQYLITPTIYTLTTLLMPLFFQTVFKNKHFSFAIQFIACKRKALEEIGGYSNIKDKINDDVNIAKEFKSHGKKTLFLDGKNYIKGTMYDSLKNAFTGIERCISDYFEKKFYPIFILSIFLIFTLVLPPLTAITAIILKPDCWLLPVSSAVIFTIAWIISMIDRRLHPISYISYPINYLILIVIAWRSYIQEKTGKGYVWKERKII